MGMPLILFPDQLRVLIEYFNDVKFFLFDLLIIENSIAEMSRANQDNVPIFVKTQDRSDFFSKRYDVISQSSAAE